MEKESIKQYLIETFERAIPKLITRNYDFPETSRIHVLIGARRVGKTFLLFQKMHEYVGQGYSRSSLLYLNFEHPLLYKKIKYDEIHILLETFWSLYPPIKNEPTVLFIDEPQVLEGWEIAVRALHDDYKFPIFITGSSSKLLSKEIATILRGRTLTSWVFPLSFSEFLSFKECNINPLDKLTIKKKAELIYNVNEFFSFGGYPEIVLQQQEIIKLRIMRDLLDLTIFRDLVQRFSIRNTSIVQQLIHFITSNTANEMSIHKMFNHFKSQGITINKNTFYDYINMLEDVSFIHTLRRYSPSIRKEYSHAPKFYLNDPGFLSLYSIDSKTRQLESYVFIHLKREIKNNPLKKLYYWKSSEEWEIDFFITEGNKPFAAIQVSYSIDNPQTKEREIRSLIECKKEFPKILLYIITFDSEPVILKENFDIEVIPFWNWALKYP